MNDETFEFNQQLELDVLVNGLTEITQDYVRQFVRQFDFIDKLTELVIPSGIASIEKGAFAYCTGLKHIRLPKSLTSIGSWAFYDCAQLTSITIPNSVTRIGSYAFTYCNSLISATFNDKTYDDVRSMDGYPWDLSLENIGVQAS